MTPRPHRRVETPRARRTALAVGAAMLLAAGCGSDGGADSAAASTSDEVLGGELAGRWAHYDIVAYEDPIMKTLIISYGYTDFAV